MEHLTVLKISLEASFYIPYERCKIKNPDNDMDGIGMDYCTSCEVIFILEPSYKIIFHTNGQYRGRCKINTHKD